MFARFGPKIYIHVNKDMNGKDSLSVTANKMFVSPIADWSVPFYMAGVRSDMTENNTVFQYSDNDGNYVGALKFPVELSETRDTIVIKPLTAEGALWYPNVIGVSSGIGGATSYVLEKPIISEVVLTKGWNEEEAAPAAVAVKSAPRATRISPKGNVEFVKYSEMSDFKSVVAPIRMKGEVMTLEKVQENFEKFREKNAKRIR